MLAKYSGKTSEYEEMFLSPIFSFKIPPANAGDIRDTDSIPRSRRFPMRRAWQPIPVFFPGESHGQWSLGGYSPQDCTELDMTEQLSTA